MTEEDFREAEAAAAAMELKLTALGEEEKRAASSEERAASSSTASASSSSTSDVAKIPRADDERRRLASEAVSGARASPREVGGRDFAGPGPGGSLREPGRSVANVTTAALPWMTGTAVNPLLRAAYLARRGLHDVTLVIPWLVPAEQKLIHPSVIFETPEEQGAYVRRWVKERCGFEPAMKLDFYPGRYATDKYSIIPVGDVSEYITDEKRDVAVLEEPEHLNWYHSGSRWSDTFDHVVGVVHTNYLEYARLEKHGEMKEKAMRLVNAWVSRVHCHKIIKLSDAVQEFPRSETVNVHGVSPVFLEVGRRKATAAAQASAAEHDPDAAAAQAMGRTVSNVLASLSARSHRREESRRAKNGASGSSPEKRSPSPEVIHPSNEVFHKGCYFLGKVVWGKGFHELLRRVDEHNTSADGAKYPLQMDVFGSGEDLDAVMRESREKGLPLTFRGRADHASDQMHDYKVFINPSLSDVVATTTAEALAMGKYVICAQHPSNAFFSTFPNCLTYDSPEAFSSASSARSARTRRRSPAETGTGSRGRRRRNVSSTPRSWARNKSRDRERDWAIRWRKGWCTRCTAERRNGRRCDASPARGNARGRDRPRWTARGCRRGQRGESRTTQTESEQTESERRTRARRDARTRARTRAIEEGVCFDGRCARSETRRAPPAKRRRGFPVPSRATRRGETRAAVEATREMTSARTRRRVGSREVDVSSRVSRSANRRLPCRGRRTTRRATRKEDSTRRQTQLFLECEMRKETKTFPWYA